MPGKFGMLQRQIQAGWKAFRFPSGSSGNPGWTGGFFGNLFPLLPSTRFDYRSQAGPLHLSGPVWAAVQWLSRTWPEAPSVVYRPGAGGKEEPVRPHPLTELLASPSEQDDASVLWMSSLLSWIVDGNVYWYVETSGAGVPVGLTYIPHYLIEPYSTDPYRRCTGYKYRVDGTTELFKLDEVLHFRNGHDPANPRKGLAPIAAELRSVCTDNEAQTYSASILRNMGVPGVVISPKDNTTDITPDQARSLKELWREAVTGDGRGTPVVPTLPIEIHNPGFSPEQLALDKIANMPIPRICAAIGVDPMVLGLPSDTKTYANLESAREGAYEQTLIPMQRIFDSQVTRQLMPRMPGARPGDRLGRDYEKVRCLQTDQDALYKRLTEAVGGPWLKPDEARADTGREPIPGGDVLYPPKGGQPPGTADEGGDVTLRAASLRAGLSAKWRERRALAEQAGANGSG